MRDRQRELADERLAGLALYGPQARPSRHLVEKRRAGLNAEGAALIAESILRGLRRWDHAPLSYTDGPVIFFPPDP